MAHVPERLTELRNVKSFLDRLTDFGDKVIMSGPSDAPMGFCVINDDEIDQMYVSKSARGTGLAAKLLAAGEARLAKAGTKEAHLYCIPENTNALRFYERQGWRNDGSITAKLTTSDGAFELNCIILRKTL